MYSKRCGGGALHPNLGLTSSVSSRLIEELVVSEEAVILDRPSATHFALCRHRTMLYDGYIIGDGSWDLKIYVTDLKVERTLRVKGDLHIGGVMFKLVEDLGKLLHLSLPLSLLMTTCPIDVAVDWSDHALWWPNKNLWLSRTRSTLDQCGVQADAILHFTPMHKVLRVQLPDLRYVDTKVDLSVKCFSAVKELCKQLSIRHPEELSFARPLGPEHLKRDSRINSVTSRQRGSRDLIHTTPHSPNTTLDSLDKSRPASTGLYGRNISSPALGFNSSGASDGGKSTPGVYDDRTSTPNWITVNTATIHANGSSRRDHNLLHSHQQRHPLTSTYASSPITAVPSPNITSFPDVTNSGYLFANDSVNLPDVTTTPGISMDAKTNILRPRNLAEKARLNSAWLDSSLSLYEQDVKEFDLILLRFKFFSFYDLSPKVDAARINQIYEQARWSILSEDVDCTENEAMMFAALQVQVSKQAKNPDSDVDFLNNKNRRNNDDDIDAALNDLQAQLEGNSIHSNGHSHRKKSTSPPHPITSDVISVPELSDYLRFSKPRRFTLKTTKKLYFVFRETSLYAYKSREDRFSDPSFVISLRGCEVTPDVNLGQLRYAVKLEVPNQEGMNEYCIRFSSEEQYAKWLAVFRLAAKGRTMSDAAYENEVRQILDFLSIQQPAPVFTPVVLPPISYTSSSNQEVNPEDVVALKILRRAKSRAYLVHRIMEAHANVRGLSFTEAKLQFIKAWQALPDQGVSLFIVRFLGSKKEVRRV